ncbi:hypothetical protein SAMN05444671_4011 [Flavobacterium sp. CF108]|nr:hypothetical protein SAMN04487978_3961 [Flavobacterium sp. fv08]SHH84305.1 hypothetical protein SAMN05444671_4011 [Flavobacterium sp. CF108]
MDIKRIYQRFFFLNTSRIGMKPTRALSSLEAGFVMIFCTILKKILFPVLHVSLFFSFSIFVILCFIIEYFNYKTYKRQNKIFTVEWKNETRKNKIIYRIYNAAFVIIIFLICIYVLEYLDNKS